MNTVNLESESDIIVLLYEYCLQKTFYDMSTKNAMPSMLVMRGLSELSIFFTLLKLQISLFMYLIVYD